MIESLKTSRDPGAMNEYLSKIVAVGPRSPAARQDVGAGLIAWLTETRTKKIGYEDLYTENMGTYWKIRESHCCGGLDIIYPLVI